MALVLCPSCRNQVNCDQTSAGMILVCPFCQQRFQIPRSSSRHGRPTPLDKPSQSRLPAASASSVALSHPSVDVQAAPFVVGESPVHRRLLRRGGSKSSQALKSIVFLLLVAQDWAFHVLESLAWRQRLSSVCRLVSPKQNPGFAISAVVHAAVLIAMALLIVPTSHGKAIRWLLLAAQQRDVNEDLEIVEEIVVQISPPEPTDDAHHAFWHEGKLQRENVAFHTEPVQLAELSLPVPGASDFDLPSVDSLLQDLEELKPARQVKVSTKGGRNIAERELAELKMPDNAIRSGSFSVFAEPADPVDGQPYWLIIQLELPPGLTRRTSIRKDMTGLLAGSDGFRMTIPSGPAFLVPVGTAIIAIPKSPDVRDRYHLGDGQARWAIWVPGASKNVKDTIHVRSQLLDEEHVLNVEF